MHGLDFQRLRAFEIVARRLRFVTAAQELGVSPSALSRTIKELEAEVGVKLLSRTTRSVSLTDAGRRLQARLTPALSELSALLAETAALAGEASGRLRIHCPSAAADVLAPHVGPFLAAYPRVMLEIECDDAPVDLVKAGFDASVRLDEEVGPSMASIALSPDLRQLVVGAPAYFQRHRAPSHPRDLTAHQCLLWRRPGAPAPYRWEFARKGVWFSVEVSGPLIGNDRRIALAAAVEGAGLTFWAEPMMRSELADGRLVAVLGDWSPKFPGWRLVHRGDPDAPAALTAFLALVRERVHCDHAAPH